MVREFQGQCSFSALRYSAYGRKEDTSFIQHSLSTFTDQTESVKGVLAEQSSKQNKDRKDEYLKNLFLMIEFSQKDRDLGWIAN